LQENRRITVGRRTLAIACLLIFLTTYARTQQEQRFVLLPEREANSLAKMYPKDGPDRINGGWQPSQPQIQSLEANLPHVSDLRSGGAPNGEKITHPELYFRQYVAVVRAGQKLIYVNAICQIRYAPDWREHVAVVMDGGNCFWQAWFDPATQKFSELYINGRA
jgi:hypothetical protein